MCGLQLCHHNERLFIFLMKNEIIGVINSQVQVAIFFIGSVIWWRNFSNFDLTFLEMCSTTWLPVTDDRLNRPWAMALDDPVHQHDQCQLQGQSLHACLFCDRHQHESCVHDFLTQPLLIAWNKKFLKAKKGKIHQFNMSDVSDEY